MKLKLNLILITVLLLFTACSSDDNNDAVSTPAIDINGTYSGYTIATCKYFTNAADSETITFTSTGNENTNISFTSKSWGSFSIKDAKVSLINGTYTISGSGKTTMGMEGTTPKEYDCTFTGTISSDKKTTLLTFNVPAVMEGFTITFKSGTAPNNMLVTQSYNGALSLSVAGMPLDPINDSKVTIISQDDDNVQVTLAGFGITGMALQDIVVPDVTVSKVTTDSYKLSGKINATSGTVVVTGSLEGTIINSEAKITFTMKPGAMPMNITAIFTGKAQ